MKLKFKNKIYKLGHILKISIWDFKLNFKVIKIYENEVKYCNSLILWDFTVLVISLTIKNL